MVGRERVVVFMTPIWPNYPINPTRAILCRFDLIPQKMNIKKYLILQHGIGHWVNDEFELTFDLPDTHT